MAQIQFANRSLLCKLVYCGPSLSGKTTNLQWIHGRTPADLRGTLCSLATNGDRTLFFDYMPLTVGTLAGATTRFQIYTVPGQAYYASTRKLVLQGCDGLVFVADSAPDRLDENVAAFAELERAETSDAVDWEALAGDDQLAALVGDPRFEELRKEASKRKNVEKSNQPGQ